MGRVPVGWGDGDYVPGHFGLLRSVQVIGSYPVSQKHEPDCDRVEEVVGEKDTTGFSF